VFHQEFYPNSYNPSTSYDDKLAQRIYSLTKRIYYCQGLKRSNFPGKRILWVNKLNSENINAIEDPSPISKGHLYHYIRRPLPFNISSVQPKTLEPRKPIKQPRSANFVHILIFTVKISTTDKYETIVTNNISNTDGQD